MGALILDASVVLALFDPLDALAARSRRAVTGRLGTETVMIPASALAEVLVGATRMDEGARRRAEVEAAMRVVACDADIAAEAARLRAVRSPLRLPDALVVATGEVLGATVLTGDRTWKRHSALVEVV